MQRNASQLGNVNRKWCIFKFFVIDTSSKITLLILKKEEIFPSMHMISGPHYHKAWKTELDLIKVNWEPWEQSNFKLFLPFCIYGCKLASSPIENSIDLFAFR